MKGTLPTLFLLFLLCCAEKAIAQCSCGQDSANSPREVAYFADLGFKNATVVFVGKVIKIERDSVKPRLSSITFQVKKAWKQDLEELVTLQGCDKGFALDTEWLVYADAGSDGTYETRCCCSSTKRLSQARIDLQTFRKNRVTPARIKPIQK